MAFSWKHNLAVLWIGVFFCSTAYSISIPFLPIFLSHELGVTSHLEAWSGVAFGITFLASALVSPFWGSLADKYGRKPMLIRSGYSLAALYFLNYFVQDPYQLLVLRVFQGLLAGYVPASIALVATNTPDKHVGYALGIMSTAGATGGIIGPLVGGTVSRLFGNREAFLFSGIVVLVAALIATFLVRELKVNRTGVRSNVRSDLKEAAANKPFIALLGLVMLATVSVMILEPLLTVYTMELGADPKDASFASGLIFSAVGVATVLAAPRWGKLGGRIGYQHILVIGLLGGGIGNLLQVFVPNLVGFGILRFFYGLFFAGFYPSVNALIVRVTEPEFRGRAFSLNQSATQLATMLGPIAGGLLGGWMPIRGVFILNGLALVVVALMFKFGKQRSFLSPEPAPAAERKAVSS
ncbi:MFS transporter [Paenibacillus sp. J31TS4]|uniref:MFS transporter n=1 Tax=Paenibacillus sp. J31TS4 TaxID=2807195 RepID=UPI001B0D2A97|nr:MFS transporter [Paenibacillus sp. J31TS4]GIP39537.1 MFS transporter [Paenibacillus sp. J31TS4]